MKTIKNSIFKSASLILGLTLLVTVLISSCSKDEENNAGPAPDLPPETSFVMDFSDFANADTTSNYKSSLGYQNWWHAASHIFVWNTVINITFAVPVAAFYESFHHEGVWDADANAWVWSYNFMAVGVSHTAKLHASLVEGGVKWQMYISKDNAFNDVLWYWGISNVANSEGEWHLNTNPQNLEEVIAIEWDKDFEGKELIKMTMNAIELALSDFDDIKIAKKVAWVLCGGDLTSPQKVSEKYLLDLEREAFLSLCGEQKTLERIQNMLESGKPLRN